VPRLAWFTPLPPVSSGVARYSAELVPALTSTHQIDLFVDGDPASVADPPAPVLSAHDFVWRHDRHPYDLIVYQLGNARCHDYMWGYLARYPGLVVLHDGQLHHARALSLRAQHREDDYREEFRANHPGVPADAAELAIAGWLGALTYIWPMRRLVVDMARMVVVHNQWLADVICEEQPSARVRVVEMGVPLGRDGSACGPREESESSSAAARASGGGAPRAVKNANTSGHAEPRISESEARHQRQEAPGVGPRREWKMPVDVRARYGIPADAVLFVSPGTATPEKRIPQAIRALAGLDDRVRPAHLLLVGQGVDHYDPMVDAARYGVADRVTLAGYVPHEDLDEYLAAADVCLCLRWPTSRETSAAWLRCLAAGRPTVITDLVHTADVPALDPRNWKVVHAQPAVERDTLDAPPVDPAAVAIDILDEDHSLSLAMRRLAADPALRTTLGRHARALWASRFTLERMAAGYRQAIDEALATPVPDRSAHSGLPPHLVANGMELAASLMRAMHLPAARVASLWRGAR
jgi:glycosyltransferase involved in cell wall biosynthesis